MIISGITNFMCMTRYQSYTCGDVQTNTITTIRIILFQNVHMINRHYIHGNGKNNLVSGSYDKTIRLWDVENGKLLLTLEGHTDAVYAMVVLPCGKLATSSADKSIRIWDTKKGECLMKLDGHTKVIFNLDVLPCDRLVSGCIDKTVRIWE